jgi:hypothetical protein
MSGAAAVEGGDERVKGSLRALLYRRCGSRRTARVRWSRLAASFVAHQRTVWRTPRDPAGPVRGEQFIASCAGKLVEVAGQPATVGGSRPKALAPGA